MRQPRTSQVMVHGKPVLVSPVVAEAVRAHRIGKDEIPAAQKAAEQALEWLALCALGHEVGPYRLTPTGGRP